MEVLHGLARANGDDYGPAALRRSMDLAAAAGASATRKSRLRAGDAAGGRGLERRRATGPTTMRPQELADASVRSTVFRSQLRPLRRDHLRTVI